MTEGLEVFVQEVIAAMTTSPWSRLDGAPSSTSSAGSLGHSRTASSLSAASWYSRGGSSRGIRALIATGSLAGKESSEASSRPPWMASSCEWPANSPRTTRWAVASGIRSCGRFGPATEGTTVLRSSSTIWL